MSVLCGAKSPGGFQGAKKKQIEQLKDLYKALLKIAEIQAENAELGQMSTFEKFINN